LADLTALQKRAYNAVRAMQLLPFDAALPWTELGLYEWFVGAVDGMRFRGDIELSFCCDPDGIINLVEGEAGQETDLWVNPQNGVGLADLMLLMVHEARHNEGIEHTCGNATLDATIEEQGAWGVQYSLLVWMADHVPAAFMRAPVEGDPGYYQEMHRGTAEWVAETFICG
jgi:hypothetical protein